MSEQPLKEEDLHLIREIETSPEINQRTLSNKLDISLGKTNYLLKELIKKGFVKARNFSSNPGRLRKIKYTLTKEGIDHRIHLTQHFLKRKEQEYNKLKKEYDFQINRLISGKTT